MAVKIVSSLGVVLVLCSLAVAAEGVVRVPKGADVLRTLRKGHPRLVLTDERLAEIKALARTDKLLAKGVGEVLGVAEGDAEKEADYLARKPVLVRKIIGPRLLGVSRDCVRRMYALGLAWRWTGKRKYLDKARENLLAVCEFKDWNPSHFLDTAEMSHGVAIGYDWCHGALDEPTRARIRKGLIRCGLEPGLAAYKTGKYGWWARNAFNWNQVCNFGLAIGALGIAETDGEYARRIVPAAVASAPKALATYAPDGAWPEGPGYWGYATRYTVYGLAAMETALGTDFGLSRIPGLGQAGHFPIHTTGPTGMYFNFADVGGRGRRGNLPALFWLARRYEAPLLAAVERDMMAARKATACDVIWYVPAPRQKVSAPKTAKRFAGPVEVAVFRSAWNDANALFAAIKAGYNQVNHGHLDLGSFEIDALGVRWARELGSDNYNLPSYWGMGPGARRWKYYRLSSLSHSVPLLDGRNQDVHAKASITKFKADGPNGLAVIDLSSAYKPLARSARRGLRMLAGRAVLIQDELDLAKPCPATWAMTTDAKIVPDGAVAALTLGGKALTARLLSPAGAKFTVESAERKKPEATNRGVRRLIVRTSAQAGPLRFAVLLAPHWPDGKQAEPPAIIPLKEWR